MSRMASLKSYPDFGRKWLYRIFRRPYFAVSTYFCLVSLFLLIPRTPDITLVYVLLGPWIVILLLFVNLPLVSAAFRKFRMTETKKRNHALEHGTIFFLQHRYGRKFRPGGKALDTGFRLSGIQNKEDVGVAFDDLICALNDGQEDCVVSNRCGSMIVVAEGLAVVLLTVSAVPATFLRFGPKASAILLLANACAFVIFRYPMGRWIQRRFFLSLDFKKAQITEIRTAKDREFFERPRVLIIKTRID